MPSDNRSPTVAGGRIKVENLSKVYMLYDRPQDRLKQSLMWRFGKTFGRPFWALRDISVEIDRGETVGIIGRNGSGKSTLLQIIAGTLQPSSGTVDVSGRVAALLELGSGFNPEYTGRENVFLNGAILGLSREDMEERFDRIASFADIGSFLDQPVKVYSSGMLARLAFATAISVDADILIADEILAVGDMAFQAKCFRTFHKLRDQGATILFVSHDPYTIRSFCQKSLYLREGVAMAWGPSYSVVDRYVTEMEKKEAQEAAQTAPAQPASQAQDSSLFVITDVRLLGPDDMPTALIPSGSDMTIEFTYESLTQQVDRVVFVVNLYRHDGLYVCGTTSLMDKHPPLRPGKVGVVKLTFPGLPLLSGNYTWRVAIDDEQGFGVYTAVTQVCPFTVTDRLEAVGLVNLPRRWTFRQDPPQSE
jgi:lipopolysaccharide transport system ATP-binding protein